VGASPCFQPGALKEDSQEVVVEEEEVHPSQAWAEEVEEGEAWLCVDSKQLR